MIQIRCKRDYTDMANLCLVDKGTYLVRKVRMALFRLVSSNLQDNGGKLLGLFIEV